MSRGSVFYQGICWDSAVMEGFFQNLKTEHVWHLGYANHGEPIKDIADYTVRL